MYGSMKHRLEQDLAEIRCGGLYKSERILLKGEIADPSKPPSGCYFHPRCRYAQKRCAEEEPALLDIGKGIYGDEHFVACHYATTLNLRGV